MGRPTAVAAPDSTTNPSTTKYVYSGNQVKVTDPAGNSKTYTMDSFGNLLTVQETDPQLGSVTTSYTYDVMNHLIGVSMPRGTATQTRTFNYNVSGTVVTAYLQSATNPETGTVSYTYNSNNTLASKTDAKGQNFTYGYDTYNRLTTIKVGGTLLRTFIYDSNTLDNTGFSQNTLGRLAAVQYPANTQGIQFNDMYSYVSAGTAGAGLPTKKRLQVNQALYLGSGQSAGTQTLNLDATYTYNNEGSVLSTTYPTTNAVNGNGVLTAYPGPAYTYSFDNMYRPAGLTTSSSTVVSGVSYGPSNQILGMTYNGISETRTYNPLLQLTSVTSSSVNMQYNYPAGPNNNGKACLATDLITGEQVVYGYDTLNRLTSANAYTFSGSPSPNCSSTSSHATWSQTYSIDAYGNLYNKVGTGGAPSFSPGANDANNQINIAGVSYDANGNLSGMSSVSYSYDPENRMIEVATVSNGYAMYGYDAKNKRSGTGRAAPINTERTSAATPSIIMDSRASVWVCTTSSSATTPAARRRFWKITRPRTRHTSEDAAWRRSIV